MRYTTLSFCSLLLLSGCGVFESKETTPPVPQKPPTQYSVATQIIEQNKEDLKQIKEKLADDIELGAKTRVLEKKHPTNVFLFSPDLLWILEPSQRRRKLRHLKLTECSSLREVPECLQSSVVLVGSVERGGNEFGGGGVEAGLGHLSSF